MSAFPNISLYSIWTAIYIILHQWFLSCNPEQDKNEISTFQSLLFSVSWQQCITLHLKEITEIPKIQEH